MEQSLRQKDAEVEALLQDDDEVKERINLVEERIKNRQKEHEDKIKSLTEALVNEREEFDSSVR